MPKTTGRFKHINNGQIIENGREVEFRLQFKSGDEYTVQIPVAELSRVIGFLQALQMKADDSDN